MADFLEYLSAYRAHVTAVYGRGKAIMAILIWLAGAIAPFGAKAYLPDLPAWAAMAWLGSWVALGFVIAPYRMWREQRATIWRLCTPEGPVPDFPIRELFEHVNGDGDLFDNHEKRWKEVGNEIMDKLSTGQISGWGRPRAGDVAPLIPIDSDYWSNSQWSFYFFAHDDLNKDAHVWTLFPNPNGPRYYDVRVCKAQVLRVWPSDKLGS